MLVDENFPFPNQSAMFISLSFIRFGDTLYKIIQSDKDERQRSLNNAPSGVGNAQCMSVVLGVVRHEFD